MRTIQVINQTTMVSDSDVAAACEAVQKQLNEHVAPAWGGPQVQLVPGSRPVNQLATAPTSETIFLLDDSDQAGALGYHELASTDVPVGYVFVKTSQEAGDMWQTTLSHEAIEQVYDPYVNGCAVVTLPMGGGFHMTAAVEMELCDPVENDNYEIDGVPVSNFVLPAWFQDQATPGIKGPYDYMQRLTASLTMTPGGYIGYTRNLKKWGQLTAKKGPRVEKYARHGRKRRV